MTPTAVEGPLSAQKQPIFPEEGLLWQSGAIDGVEGGDAD